MIGSTSMSSNTTATALASGQSRLLKNSDPQRTADHQRFRTAEQVGDDELADGGNEHQEASPPKNPGKERSAR